MIQVIKKEKQAYGEFNGGAIIENKPIGFPQDGGKIKPYSCLFYWAYALAKEDSTIGLHPHQGFEIMSFVLKGTIRHFDTKLNEWKPLKTGDAQIIRAGNGISHAEHLSSDSAIFQIWFDPDLSATLNQPPSYENFASKDFPLDVQKGMEIKTYVGENAPLKPDTADVHIEQINLFYAEHVLETNPASIYSIYVLEGKVELNDVPVEKDDFVILPEIEALKIKSRNGIGSLFIISCPAVIQYKTYAELIQEKLKK